MNLTHRNSIILLIATTMLLGACGPDTAESSAASRQRPESGPSADGPPYAFDAPEASLPLPEELTEISGLTVLTDGNLAAVQDEAGTVYVLNPESGNIEEQIPFEKAGDYEGIELAGDRLFTLRSNGSLVALSGWETGSPELEHFETFLKSKNDTEGLAYDASQNRLLIVTKEDAGSGLDKDDRAIYAFDLATGTLAEEPIIVLNASAIEDQIDGKGKFRPSAVAVHPASGDLYVLSSVLKAVIRVGMDGKVGDVWSLSEETYEQPEGLAFLPNGDLVISSEGVDRPAMLHRLAPSGGF